MEKKHPKIAKLAAQLQQPLIIINRLKHIENPVL